MRKLMATAFLSLDGVMQAPGGPDEDRDGGFEHGGWAVPLFDDKLMQLMVEHTGRAGALLLGRKTYEMFAASWPLAGDDDPMNSIPKYVASRTLDKVSWNNSKLLTGDVAAAVRQVKAGEGGEIQVHGSSGLLQTLLEHDLVDEFHLIVIPVMIGTGKRLFAGGTLPGRLKLLGSTMTSTGVVASRYERDGRLEYGLMDVDEQTSEIS
jgi:dihydrofolate reductase